MGIEQKRVILNVSDVRYAYGRDKVLQDVSFHVREGEFLTILGESGVGKTTLLRVLAGLLKPHSGSISFDGKNIDAVPTRRRPMAMVPQSCGLFDTKSVIGNVLFPLHGGKFSHAERLQIAKRILQQLEIWHLSKKKPKQLSGGQEQRVALARAFARIAFLNSMKQASVLLLDEPFSALDRSLRLRLQELVRRLMIQYKTTVLYVTHDQAEAAAVSDRIVLISNGQVLQCASPKDFYTKPVSVRVAKFLGTDTVFCGTVMESEAKQHMIMLTTGEKIYCDLESGLSAGETVYVFVPPDKVRLSLRGINVNSRLENQVGATIQRITYHGQYLRVIVMLSDEKRIDVVQTYEMGDKLAEGMHVFLQWDITDCHSIPSGNQSVSKGKETTK